MTGVTRPLLPGATGPVARLTGSRLVTPNAAVGCRACQTGAEYARAGSS